ncbi:MAG: hypothetical protein V4675_13800 [Verrucomicrobiota bacterium]
MNQPQNLPELLQARLKLGLFNWGKRTVIWTMALGLLSAIAPGLRFLLIGWLIFSALSLAALLLGLKLAKNLRVSTATFPQGMNEARDVGGDRMESSDEADDYPSHHSHTGRNAVSDEIIEIEAEILPPEKEK